VGLIDVVGVGPVALDTACFIYFAEQHPSYAALIRPLFEAADQERLVLCTSSLTLLEVLVVPYRSNRPELASQYESLLTESRGIHLIAIDHAQLRVAAQLRARFALRTPDAMQLAAAISARCSSFVTNDRRLPDVPGLRVVQLSSLTGA
jgi:predicted nucleic acid-binding protein